MQTSLSATPFQELGFLRVAAIAPELQIADVKFNCEEILKQIELADSQGVEVALFPELALTGYSCGDLFYQSTLLESAVAGLGKIAEALQQMNLVVIVGLPYLVGDRLYNAAAVVDATGLKGLVPKSLLPNSQEYYEKRWFSRGGDRGPREARFQDRQVAFGNDLLFTFETLPDVCLGVEICEELWAVEPPSGRMALGGANLIVNPSASLELLGKSGYRHDLVKQQSARCIAGYVYASSGPGESTADVVFGGHTMIAENGRMLAEGDRFVFESQSIQADLDLQSLRADRLRHSSFISEERDAASFRIVHSGAGNEVSSSSRPLLRPIAARPFVPSNAHERAERCQEIFSIQRTGLLKRLRHMNCQRVVLGISGGLDSTLALLVAVAAFDKMKWDRHGIVAPTMPGLGTTSRTRSNAEKLADFLGVDFSEIPIGPAVQQHFADIGHDPNQLDVTFENAQARERTQILMDLANQRGGLVLGTGDLSESALGWCTFNGDHMSMYHVNAGVPKTLVRYLVDWAADALFERPTAEVLHDIVATPITPELLPTDELGELKQETEASIGPYELHDFFLFYSLRHAAPPRKVAVLAAHAFAGRYDDAAILQWLDVFYRRFFGSQFKRNSMPDGPKVGSIALSPRGDWRMPSDATGRLWQEECAKLSKPPAG